MSRALGSKSVAEYAKEKERDSWPAGREVATGYQTQIADTSRVAETRLFKQGTGKLV